MPTTTLTAAAIERLKTPPAGQIEYFDRRLPSFGVGGCTRRGSRVVGLAATGKDPRQIRSEAKQKRQEERRNSFDVCADEFLQKYAERHLRPSTQREYRRILKGKDTRVWRDCPLSAIGKRDVLDVLEEIDARGSPGASKRTLAYLRKFFNWCADRDIITICPTDRIRSPHPEVKRDRVLTEHELNYLLRALDAEQSVFGPLIRVLLLTGQRRAEVAGMLWSEMRDLCNENALWEIPGHRTKNKHSHLVPIQSAVQKLLLGLPRISGFVFTTTGDTPVSGFGKVKARLDARINNMRRSDGLETLPPWTLHDLRRTMVTVMNEKLRTAPHIVEAVVNHLSGSAKVGVAGVYNRALYLEDRRRALRSWENWLSDIRQM